MGIEKAATYVSSSGPSFFRYIRPPARPKSGLINPGVLPRVVLFCIWASESFSRTVSLVLCSALGASNHDNIEKLTRGRETRERRRATEDLSSTSIRIVISSQRIRGSRRRHASSRHQCSRLPIWGHSQRDCLTGRERVMVRGLTRSGRTSKSSNSWGFSGELGHSSNFSCP